MTPTGIYAPRCGFDAMHFTWTAPEYLSLVAAGSGGRLPFAAMFLLRYQVCPGAARSLTAPCVVMSVVASRVLRWATTCRHGEACGTVIEDCGRR